MGAAKSKNCCYNEESGFPRDGMAETTGFGLERRVFPRWRKGLE